jgi:hypothetical protein
MPAAGSDTLKVGKYTLEGTCAQIHAKLTEAVRIDEQAEAQVLKGWIRVGWGCAGVLVGGFAALFSLALAGEQGWAWGLVAIGLIVAVVGLGALVQGLVLKSKAAPYDLDDRKLGTARRFLEVVRADVAPEARLRLELDFRDHRQFLVRKTSGGWFSGQTFYEYAQDWLAVSGRLLDRTAFKISVALQAKAKHKAKRKYTKVKERSSEDITLILRPDPAEGLNLDALPALLPAPPPGLTPRSVRVAGGRLVARFATSPQVTVRGRYGTQVQGGEALVTGPTLLQVMAWAYRGLNALRAQSQPAA